MYSGKISPGDAEILLKALGKAGLRQGMKVLEIGCAAGRMSRLIAERFCCEVTGVDTSRAAIEEAAGGPPPRNGSVRFLREDAGNTGGRFPCAADNTKEPSPYDIVCSECTLSLIEGKRELFEKISAALVPGGKLVLLDMRVSKMEDAIRSAGFTKIYEEDLSDELLSWAGQIIFDYGSLAAYFESVTPAGEDVAAYCGPFAGENPTGSGYAMSIFGNGPAEDSGSTAHG
ncbi:MAG: class I SAM-dependent methyltransferase [Clostridiales Family XIII bacterium]|jgi:SAM-dependent methyltransferase|nr:class I SAM-dependent methyltransferase [Clostridiales Family XIII bacterium]